MSDGLKVLDAVGNVILDSTTLTYTLFGTIYCPAGQTVSQQFTVGDLLPFALVYLTDTFAVTITPTLANISVVTTNGVAVCNVSGGTVGCTAYVFAL